MSPSAFGACLSQTSPCLARANEEAAGALDRRRIWLRTAGFYQLFAREGGQTDESDKLVAVISQAAEEVHHLRIQVIIGLNGRRWPVD